MTSVHHEPDTPMWVTCMRDCKPACMLSICCKRHSIQRSHTQISSACLPEGLVALRNDVMITDWLSIDNLLGFWPDYYSRKCCASTPDCLVRAAWNEGLNGGQSLEWKATHGRLTSPHDECMHACAVHAYTWMDACSSMSGAMYTFRLLSLM